MMENFFKKKLLPFDFLFDKKLMEIEFIKGM